MDSLFSGEPSPVDLSSTPAAPFYEENLRAGATYGPNFAGHLTVVSWGCGTACEMHAVVDARTGYVYPQALVTGSSVEYRLDSRLLVADALHPGDEDCPTCGVTASYVWRSDHFEPVGDGPHPHLRTLQ